VNTLWMAKAWHDDDWVYLTQHVGRSKAALIEKIMEAARRERFTGTIDERLKSLGWVIVGVEFKDRA